MMTWWQLGFQDSNSPLMEEFIYFHDFSMLILVFISSSVFVIILMLMNNSFISRQEMEHQMLETVWTLIPGLILVQLAIPSLSLLYMMEEDLEHSLTVKSIGHQWYWSYELTEFEHPICFDSYMTAPLNSQVRLLEVDNRLTLPSETSTRMLISSADVLHAWTVPSLGVKADACPGRVNQVQFTPHRPGLFFGQCSEICGANHSFMPIVVEVVNLPDFISWAIEE